MPPVVGTGPYSRDGVRPGPVHDRSPATPTTGASRGAADEVIITHFENNATMVAGAEERRDRLRPWHRRRRSSMPSRAEPNIVTVEGFANGYSYLTFNGYPDPSRAAAPRRPPWPIPRSATRSARRSTCRSSSTARSPATARPERASCRRSRPTGTCRLRPTSSAASTSTRRKQKLEAAGYELNDSGQLLDKEGKPIVLRMTWPASEEELATVAQFITEWWGELGITRRGRQ